MTPPAFCRPAAYAALAEALPDIDSTAGLLRGACAIARHEHGDTDVLAVERSIEGLAETVQSRVRSHLTEAILAHLHDVLFEVVGLGGNVEDYYNPANSYVPQVLRTGRGIPISLTLVYKCVANRVGLVVHGINAPGHFLAGVECQESRPTSAAPAGVQVMYVDPFYGGGLLDRHEVFERIAETTGRAVSPSAEMLARATHRQWLGRMLHNLQGIFATAGRERDLLAMQEMYHLLAE